MQEFCICGDEFKRIADLQKLSLSIGSYPDYKNYRFTFDNGVFINNELGKQAYICNNSTAFSLPYGYIDICITTNNGNIITIRMSRIGINKDFERVSIKLPNGNFVNVDDTFTNIQHYIDTF